MRVGIFLGGNSREREISFAGGRTVFDNLDKALFKPIPIFVDSFNNFILLPWQLLYKGAIRDFYPNESFVDERHADYQLYAEAIAYNQPELQIEIALSIGEIIPSNELKKHIDFAFLALHGANGEDGRLQGLLEWNGIPYSGSGIFPSAIGINKRMQREWMQSAGFISPNWVAISREQWLKRPNDETIFTEVIKTVGAHFVVKSANQGSSIGLQLLNQAEISDFVTAVDTCFFIKKVNGALWHKKSATEKHVFLQEIVDIRTGLGLPVLFNGEVISSPNLLMDSLNKLENTNSSNVFLEALSGESEVIFESFIYGKEFSCIVVENLEGQPLALPPTGIIKETDFFDYRAKYLPGLSRKVTPMDVPFETLNTIREKAVELFKSLNFSVYARIDGFLGNDGKIYLNDPNTTSGMLPASFFFHQAAEIGLSPGQFLTYIIETSLKARARTGYDLHKINTLISLFANNLNNSKQSDAKKTRIGVIMGGYSSEKHISVESGRNVVEKLASSTKYLPVPIFLAGKEKEWTLFTLPVALMLKDNADDINAQLMHFTEHPALSQIRIEAQPITNRFNQFAIFEPKRISFEELKVLIDGVFIALHGRPGEDGSLQQHLLSLGIPFNGSMPNSSEITINKFETNAILRQNGMKVADHALISKDSFIENNTHALTAASKKVGFPLIAKPVDDGCSSAVKKVHNLDELEAFAEGVFRASDQLPIPERTIKTFNLYPTEAFPAKKEFLIESFIDKGNAVKFMEVTGGMFTKYGGDKSLQYIVFEPSESLAISEVLSLEEKFLAGQGLNITPARFDKNPQKRQEISEFVKNELLKAATILNVTGYCRIDAFVKILHNQAVEVYIIEINSLPGMTPATCIFHQSALAGLTPLDFIDSILDFGFQSARN